MATRVVNCRIERGTVYIGRRTGKEHYGNPFSHKASTARVVRVRTRAEALARFRKWLREEDYLDVEPERRAWILANLKSLKGQVLECFCKPLDCHGDVYVEMVGG